MKEQTAAEGYGCICPTDDPVDCVQSRYKMDRLDALAERCECSCHDDWQREMDEINDHFEDDRDPIDPTHPGWEP